MNEKKVKFDLTSVDGNAFSLLGGFQKAARKAGWTSQEIEKVRTEAMSGDYNHLVATLLKHCS